MSNPTITVQPHGTASGTNRFGSYRLISSKGVIISEEKNVPLGEGTADEACFMALCVSLDRLFVESLKRKIKPADVKLKIVTGSTPLWTKIQKPPQEQRPEDKLELRRWLYTGQCWRRLRMFGGHEVRFDLDMAKTGLKAAPR